MGNDGNSKAPPRANDPARPDDKGAFPQTRWSLILEAQNEDPFAMADICSTYWYPIYAFARRAGNSVEDAEDLTQGFFQTILGTDFIKEAREERGRLRSLLLASFRNYTTKQHRRNQTQKRGSGERPIAIDAVAAEKWLEMEPADKLTPEIEFDRAWARSILVQAKEKLAAAYAEAGKSDEFEALKDQLEDTDKRPYADVAHELDIEEAAARYAAFSLRRRYGELLREVVAETVLAQPEIEAELAHLKQVFKTP